MWTELALWVRRGRRDGDLTDRTEMDGVLAVPVDWYLATWWTFGAEMGLLSFGQGADDALEPPAELASQRHPSHSTRA
jgi:hypothetical protein